MNTKSRGQVDWLFVASLGLKLAQSVVQVIQEGQREQQRRERRSTGASSNRFNRRKFIEDADEEDIDADEEDIIQTDDDWVEEYAR